MTIPTLSWKRLSLALALAVLVTLLGSRAADARVAPEVRAGYFFDAEAAMIGGGALFPTQARLMFNPNAEWVFVDNVTFFTLNGDFHFDLNPGYEGPAYWVGAGVALLYADIDNDLVGDSDADIDVGLNLIGGLGAKRGSARPFVQGKLILSDNSEFSVAGGLRF